MTLVEAERIAATAAAKPYAMRQGALTWAKAKRRDRTVSAETRARAAAVVDALHADMTRRDGTAGTALASRTAA